MPARPFGTAATRISSRAKTVAYPRIDGIHDATKLSNRRRTSGISVAEPAPTGSGEIKLPLRLHRGAPLARSPGCGVRHSTSWAERNRCRWRSSRPSLLSATRPFSADFAGARFIQLYLYAHRVDGLQPGVYRLWPDRAELEQIRSGDQRVAAAGLSLGQELAGNACVAFSMIGDLERAARAHGDRGYRYVHFEAGAIGHRCISPPKRLG